MTYESNMSLLNSFGLICEIDPNVKGYTRLTISTNIPFKTKLLKFNVWDTLLLKKSTLEPFKIGEEVHVKYSYKNTFPQLVSMELSRIDNCPICFSSLEGIDSQRWECEGCRLIPEDEHKKRVNKQMQLVSKSLKEYDHCKGYRLEFYCASEHKAFNTVIFEGNFVYKEINKLRVGDTYWVVGWVTQNGRFLDIVDIY